VTNNRSDAASDRPAVLQQPAQLSQLFNLSYSQEQLAAASAELAPQLIVAGAGTGKTAVMAARVVWLVGSGALPPGQVLGLTFTNKAAAELRSRVRRGLELLPGTRDADELEPTVLTYDSFARRVLNEFGALLGVEEESQLLTDAQRSRLAYRVACQPADSTGLTGSVVALAGKILAMDDSLANLDTGTEELRQFDEELLQLMSASSATAPDSIREPVTSAAAERIRLSRLVDQLWESKIRGEYLDFADIQRLAAELVRAVPLVRQRLRQRFGVVLLDEYQDTSRVQRCFLQDIFEDGHPVTAVGDPCQAIYGWRGASVTNIDEFQHHFPNADQRPATAYNLTINRRSGPEVLHAANLIATELRQVHEQAQPLTAASNATPASLRCALLATEADELAWLGDQIADQLTKRKSSDVAVLCRDNKQAAAVTAELRERGLPLQIGSKQELLAAPEVVWVTDLLKLLVDPYANPELVHQLSGPRWRVGPRDLALLGRRAAWLAEQATGAGAEVSLLDAVADPGPDEHYQFSAVGRERFAAFLTELDALGRFRERPVAEIVAEVIELLAPLVIPPGSGRLPQPLIGLLELARQFRSLSGGRSLGEFVSYLADCQRFQSSPGSREVPSGDGVRVMTVHAAKGLEFPVVVLPFLREKQFPTGTRGGRWATSSGAIPPVAPDEPDVGRKLGFPAADSTRADDKAYQEACAEEHRLDEDRLAYVAVTRAEQELIASGHWWGAQQQPRKPSPYLLRIEQACRETGGVIDSWQDEPGEDPRAAAADQPPITWPPTALAADAVGLADEVNRTLAQLQQDPAVADQLLPGPWQEEIEGLLRLRQAERDTAALVRFPEVLSVSRLLQWRKDPKRFLADLIRPMPTKPSAAAERGTQFHAYVEQRMGQQELFDLADWIGDEAEAEQNREFEELFAQTRFADVEPAAVEQSFVIETGGVVLTGRIDAVFRCDHPDFDWEVVDWKTGSLRRADPQQLSVYQAAWAAATDSPPERIRGVFVQLDDGSERVFDDLPPIDIPDLPSPVVES
jgi:DNA helicase-2/ATP-dependent DNA helicase PcrA